MAQIKAVRTEVYSRVSGYYTPTNTWNLGKKAEFADRKMVDLSAQTWPAETKKEPTTPKLIIGLVS